MSTENPSEIGPGESKLFQYFGEMIPNQVIVENLSSTSDAQFIMTTENTDGSWKYYGSISASQAASVWVEFPTSLFQVTNRGDSDASIIVGGDGIFPYKASTT